jgi:hypothetical protein
MWATLNILLFPKANKYKEKQIFKKKKIKEKEQAFLFLNFNRLV